MAKVHKSAKVQTFALQIIIDVAIGETDDPAAAVGDASAAISVEILRMRDVFAQTVAELTVHEPALGQLPAPAAGEVVPNTMRMITVVDMSKTVDPAKFAADLQVLIYDRVLRAAGVLALEVTVTSVPEPATLSANQ